MASVITENHFRMLTFKKKLNTSASWAYRCNLTFETTRKKSKNSERTKGWRANIWRNQRSSLEDMAQISMEKVRESRKAGNPAKNTVAPRLRDI